MGVKGLRSRTKSLGVALLELVLNEISYLGESPTYSGYNTEAENEIKILLKAHSLIWWKGVYV